MSQWFYAKNGQQLGPVSDEQIQAMVANGVILPTDLVWREGMPQWVATSDVMQLQSAFNSAAAPGQYAPPGMAAPLPMPGGNYPAPLPLGYSAPTQTRPTSVTVIAILGIIFGSLGLLGNICGIIGAGALSARTSSTATPIPFAWMLIGSILGLGIGSVLIASSINALKLVPWARKGLLVYAVATIALNVLNAVITLSNFSSSSPNASFTFGFAIGGLVGGMIFPVCVLVFMTRPHVVAAFENMPVQ